MENTKVKSAILAHAKQEFPRECCGVIVIFKGREKYIPCTNTSEEPLESFRIHEEDYAMAEDMFGEISKIVHSHPITNAHPSEPDLVSIEHSGIPWIIVNPVTEQFTETLPSGYKAPLIGRVFAFGVLDCFSLIRDYYKEELNIELKDGTRSDGFWERGQDLYTERFEEWGFRKIPLADIKPNDILIMTNGTSVPIHGAVYLGDGIMLHHVQGRLSSKEVFGGYWLHNLAYVLRYVDL